MRRLVLLAFPIALLAQPARPTVGPIDTGRTVFRLDTILPNGLRVTLAHVGRSPKALVRVVLSNACQLDIDSSGDSVGHMGGALWVSALPDRTDVNADVLRDFIAPTIDLIAPRVRAAQPDSTSDPWPPVNADAAGMRALQEAFTGHKRASGCLPVTPSRTRVLVAGIFSDRAALNAITRAFGDWPDDSLDILDHADHRAAHFVAPPVMVIHRAGAKQSAILVGSLASDDASFRVADAILGANVVSRITMNIREAKGYAYAPTSVLTIAPSGTSWVEIADVSTGVTAPALREILFEIKRLGTEIPDATEVDGAKRYLLGRYLVETATRSGWADRAELPSAASDMKGLAGVTSDSVRQAVATWLAPKRLAIVVVGDTTALGDQVTAIRAMAAELR